MESAGVNFNIDPNQQIPVLDSTANKILDSIYKYLSNISDNIDETGRNTNSHLDEISRGQRREENSATARSKASQSNDRAVQKALAGISNNQRNSLANESRNRAVDRALAGNSAKAMNNNFKNLLGGILGGLRDLGGLLMPRLTSHFKSQADLAKRLRQNFATREEKDKAQRMANSMQGTVEAKFGFKLDRSEINDYLLSLQSMGKDLDTMGEERVAAFAALKKSGLSDEAALKAAMSASADTVNKLTDAATDPRARQLIIKQIETASEAELAMNGVDNVFGQIIVSSQNMSKNAGNAITDFDKMSESLANNRRAANGMTEEVDGAMLAIQGGIKTIGSEGNALVENANKYSVQQLRALASSGDEATKKMANQMLQIKNMQASGAEIGTKTRSSAQNKSAKRDNATDGKLNFEIQKLMGKLDNTIFGGMFGKMANSIDEMFGGSTDITTIASTGFRVVAKLLTSINLKTGFMGKALLGLGGVAAVVALIANWDKIKPKLGEIFDNIKPMLAKFVQNLPGFIKDIVSGIGSLFSKFVQNLPSFAKDIISGIGDLLPRIWEGLKSAFSGFFSGDGLLGKAGSSISGSLSGLSKSLAGSGKSAAGSVKSAASKVDLSGVGQSIKDSAPTFKGFFDGLGSAIADAVPGIRDIILKVVDVIDKFIDIVAPAVPAIVQVLQTVAEAIIPTVDAIREIGVSVVDCIRELGVSLIDGVKEIVVTTVDAVKEVLLALAEPIRLIAEAVNVLVKAIAPVVPKIISTIEYAVKNILPQVLNLMGEVVRTILPPILNIAKKVVDTLLPPIVDAFTKLVDIIMPPIAEVLQTVAELIDRIVNLVLDILEPPLKAISRVITSVANFVDDIVGVSHGLFDLFIDSIPTIIGWISGVFKWLKNGIGPVISSGFSLIKDTLFFLWDLLKEILTKVIVSPILAVFNMLNYVVKGIRLGVIELCDWGPENEETKQARQEYEDAKFAAFGATGIDAIAKQITYENAKRTYEQALEGNDMKALEAAAEALKAASEGYRAEHNSLAEKAEIDRQVQQKRLGNSLDKFGDALTSDTLLNGPKFDTAAADKAQEIVNRMKNGNSADGITMQGNVTLPENTGSLLETITGGVEKHTYLLTKIYDFITKIKTYAKGTPGTHEAGLVGEAGREAIVPLDDQAAMKKVVDKMAPGDKKNIANATGVVKGTAADIAIAFARDQAAAKKPYSIFKDGFVCNTLVHAAYKKAGLLKGWDLNYHNVSKWWVGEPRLHKVPLSEAKPGMIGFSNKSKTTGNPQHMGIITENGKWINASGSAVNGDYSRKNFRATPDSKGVIEVKMNKKGMVGAGYLDGMFNLTSKTYTPSGSLGSPDGIAASPAEQITSQNGSSTAQQEAATVVAKELTPEEYSQLYSNLAEGTDVVAEGVKAKTDTQLETLQNLSKNAINTVIAQTNGQVRYDVSNSKSAKKVSDSNSQRDEIVLAMKDVVKYLRDMAAFVKKPTGASVPARLPHA